MNWREMRRICFLIDTYSLVVDSRFFCCRLSFFAFNDSVDESETSVRVLGSKDNEYSRNAVEIRIKRKQSHIMGEEMMITECDKRDFS